MFNDEGLKEYEKYFDALGALDKADQQQILDFVYSFAVVAYDLFKC